jgi:DNA polymerase-3 subunit epsilon
MNWLRRVFRRPPRLSEKDHAAVTAYQQLPAPPAQQALRATRFVVVDVESSGLDPYRDRLLSIGAVVVQGDVIRVGEALEVVLRQQAASDSGNILVHGIDGTTQLGGREPREALLEFMACVGRSPLAGYHVDFDRIMIERAMQKRLGISPINDWLDVGRILAALFPQDAGQGRGLDYWQARFSIENVARHSAVADALATAQLLQIALAKATTSGIERYGALRGIEQEQIWLERTQPRR